MSKKFPKPSSKRVVSCEDARRHARKRLPRLIFDYAEGATGREVAALKNREAFDAIELTPRVLQQVGQRSMLTNFLGQDFERPFGIAPMGMCNAIWPGADKMIAEAARQFKIPACLSLAGSSTIEEMHTWAKEAAWFQLYVNQTPEFALKMADRAQDSGYKKLILTVDVPQVSRRVRDIRNGFTLPFRMGPRHFLDFALHPHWSLVSLLSGKPSPKNFAVGSGPGGFDRNASRAGADWAFLDRIRERWKGALIVKGVMRPQDAQRIKEAGADAIWVSNHGGRQFDSAPPAITALPLVRQAIGPDMPILFDSGIRQGEDIACALALGANFVMLGRPVLYAIGAHGQKGLNALITLLSEELDVAMAQLGATSIAALRDHLKDQDERNLS